MQTVTLHIKRFFPPWVTPFFSTFKKHSYSRVGVIESTLTHHWDGDIAAHAITPAQWFLCHPLSCCMTVLSPASSITVTRFDSCHDFPAPCSSSLFLYILKKGGGGERKDDLMSVYYLPLNFLWEQETKQQRSDKKGAKGDMMELEETLAVRRSGFKSIS